MLLPMFFTLFCCFSLQAMQLTPHCSAPAPYTPGYLQYLHGSYCLKRIHPYTNPVCDGVLTAIEEGDLEQYRAYLEPVGSREKVVYLSELIQHLACASQYPCEKTGSIAKYIVRRLLEIDKNGPTRYDIYAPHAGCLVTQGLRNRHGSILSFILKKSPAAVDGISESGVRDEIKKIIAQYDTHEEARIAAREADDRLRDKIVDLFLWGGGTIVAAVLVTGCALPWFPY